MQQSQSAPCGAETRSSSWSAVFALSLGAFALVASEFMPVSLLTPLASELRVSEGEAGQAIAVSGAFAVLTSLFISSVASRIGRKVLLLALTGLMIVSGTIAAAAPNYAIFMIGRAFIGVAIGGFWSMSAAVAMQLVRDDQVPRALAIVNGGNALATVVAAPLGSFLGGLVGWRAAFFLLVPIAAVAFVWQWTSLPSLSNGARASGNVFKLFRSPVVALGMAAVGVFFMGQFALFTYVRPFLETATHVDISMLSLILLMIGVSGFIGTIFIGALLTERRLYPTLVAIPVLMAAIALSLVAAGSWLPATAVLLGAWGLFATSAPVGWWTWLAKTLPNDAEAGGGLMVAVVQLAITMGATAGGLLFDMSGYQSTFVASAGILLLTALMAHLTGRFARLSA